MAQTPDTEQAAPIRKKPARPRTAKPAHRSPWAGGLALVFAVIALLISGWMAYIIEGKRGLTDAKGRVFKLEKETAQLQDLSSGFDKELAAMRETQSTLTTSLESLHNEIGKGRRTWLLAETENLLVIAQHRLAYARDTRLALEAVRAADRQLMLLGDPDYQPVRKQIEAEIAALDAFERLDLGGMARRLGQVAGRVDNLPFRPEAPPAPVSGETDFLREIWHDIKGLVRIRTTTDLRRPLLLPEQKYFLRENLRLMLFGAQIALLHGDGTTFEQNLKRARLWLNDYFDTDAGPVQEAVGGIDAALKVRPGNLPELGASLKTLRDVRARQAKP